MIRIIRQPISPEEVKSFLGKPYDEMIKFVADIRRNILALGGELHADAEALLLEADSHQEDLWGGNYYPNHPVNQRIEYTSLINLRPSVGNRKTEIQDKKIREAVKKIVEKFLS